MDDIRSEWLHSRHWRALCICIDCRWVDRCCAYHMVERQHGEPHLNGNPDFEPVQPQINVSVRPVDTDQGRTSGMGVEWDVVACGSFSREAGRWAMLRPGQALPT